MKKKLAPFQMIEIDVKDLQDIEKYWRKMRKLRLPRYQFTARDVRTGGGWTSNFSSFRRKIGTFLCNYSN